MMSPNIKLLCLISFWLVGSNAIKCYTPNGDERNEQFGYSEGELYAPCSASANHSMCCAWGSLRVAGGSADVCLDNGLCQGGDNTWRESCTDRTWQDPACLKLFVNGTGYGADPIVYDGELPITDVTVTECDNGSFCAGTGNRACCQQGQGVFLNAKGEQVNEDPRATTSSTSSATSTIESSTSSSLSSSTTSTSPTSTATGNNQALESSNGGGLSTGAKAGIGAGVGGAALVAIIFGAFWFMRRKRTRKEQNRQSAMTEQSYNQEATPKHHSSELQNSGHGKDYPGPTQRAELESPPTTLRDKGSSQSSSFPAMSQIYER